MKNFIHLSFVLLLFVSSSLFSQEFEGRPLMSPNPPELVGLSRTDFFKEQIEKMQLRGIIGSNFYELVVAGKESKTNQNIDHIAIHVKPEVDDPKKFEFATEIISGKNGKILRRIVVNGIPERFLLLQIRINLASIFKGEEEAKATEELLEKEDPAFKEFNQDKKKSEKK